MSTAISRLTMFVVNIVAARALTQESFGQFIYLRSAVAMVDGIIGASFGNIMVKKASEYRCHKLKLREFIFSIFFINFCFILVVAGLVHFFLDEILYYLFLDNSELTNLVYISIAVLLFTVLSSLAQKINIGLSNYSEMVAMALIGLTLGLPIVLFSLKFYGTNGLMFGVAMYFLLDAVLKIIIFIKKQKIVPFGSLNDKFFENMNDVLKSSTLLVISAIISSISFWTFRSIIVNKAEEFSVVAAFDAAYQLGVIILLITGGTTSVALQMLSGDKANQARIFKLNFAVNIFIALVFSSILALFANEAMSLYGPKYTQYSNLIYIVCLIAIFATINSIYNKLLISNNDLRIILYHTIVVSVICISFATFSNINDFSMLLALTFLLYYFCFFLLDSIYILRRYKKYFLEVAR